MASAASVESQMKRVTADGAAINDANYNLGSAHCHGCAGAIGGPPGESRGARDRPAAADPREGIRHVHPEKADVDQTVDVDKSARDQCAILLAHRDIVQTVERQILNH